MDEHKANISCSPRHALPSQDKHEIYTRFVLSRRPTSAPQTLRGNHTRYKEDIQSPKNHSIIKSVLILIKFIFLTFGDESLWTQEVYSFNI